MIAIALLLQVSCSPSDNQEPSPTVAKPAPSAGHALVYHDSLGAVLLLNSGLGGMNPPASSTHGEIWKWTGQAWQKIDSAGPPVRNLAGVAYDTKRNRLVMHGGSYDLNLVYDETWEWSPTAGWEKRTVSGPGRRDHVDMAYDAAREQVVLFGGQIGLDSFPPDTWTWDGTTWAQAATSGPAPRVHHSLVYDPGGQRVLLFGGAAPLENANKGDTWAWNGSSWSSAATAVSPRTHARIARTSTGLIVLGGIPTMNGAVLALTGTTWQSVSQANAPSARYLPAAAFDPVRNVTVVFGGGDLAGNTLYGDTWEYSVVSGWRRLAE